MKQKRLIEPTAMTVTTTPAYVVDEDFEYWAPTVVFLQRLGATRVYRAGLGLGAVFSDFAVESQIYPTRGVAALGSDATGTTLFKLSSVVDEPRAFSLMLHRPPRVTNFVGDFVPALGDVLKITFAPVPDRHNARGPCVDERELARRYAMALAYLIDDDRHRHRLPLPGDAPVEEQLVRMLPA